MVMPKTLTSRFILTTNWSLIRLSLSSFNNNKALKIALGPAIQKRLLKNSSHQEQMSMKTKNQETSLEKSRDTVGLVSPVVINKN